MPEPVNPKLDPRPSQLQLCVNTGDWWARVDASDDVCLHARCEGEHRTYIAAAWLASDEVVERVARAMVDQLPGGPARERYVLTCELTVPWRWQLTTADLGKARAVLAALRGDGNA